jgi:hypothetical protein
MTPTYTKSSPRFSPARVFLLLAALCAGLQIGRYLATNSLIGGDAVYYYMNLRSIIADGDIDFANESEHYHGEKSGFTGNRKISDILPENPVTGMRPNKYPLGSAIALIPPFGLAHLVALLVHSLGLVNAPDGYGFFHQLAAGLGSLGICLAGVYALCLYGSKNYSGPVSMTAAVAVFLATPLIYYATMEPLMSHAVSMGAISVYFGIWYLVEEKRLRHWLALGAVGGLICITRYQDVFFVLLPGLDWFLRKLFGEPAAAGDRPTAAYAFAFLLALGTLPAVQLLANTFLYGSPFATGYSGEGFPFLLRPKILQTLFSAHNGLLVWSPVIWLSLVGLGILIKLRPSRGVAFATLFLIQVYLASAWWSSDQGDSFGNRMLTNCGAVFAIGLMQMLEAVWPRRTLRAVTLAICALCIVLNFALAGLYCYRIVGNPY